jgi:hypothetical protein
MMVIKVTGSKFSHITGMTMIIKYQKSKYHTAWQGILGIKMQVK